ncbi:MAG: FAD-dependent oxidoreductase [Kofleriaceae bacterium]
MKIAIIGSGIAGLGAADVLASAHEVTLFEAAARPGGHVYTVDTDAGPVDMGFIVHNREHYPQFCGLLRRLGIESRPTVMSFSVADGSREWGSASGSAMFADRRNLASPRHWRFLIRVVRFLAQARRDLYPPYRDTTSLAERHAIGAPDGTWFGRLRAGHAGRAARDESLDGSLDDAAERAALPSSVVAASTLDEYLALRRVPRDVRDHFVIPLAAALWSLAPARCGEFPALTYLAFLEQHGMLSPSRPLAWHTIAGGSRRYVEALLEHLRRRQGQPFGVELATPVRAIVRDAAGITIVAERGSHRFDRVIVATHADTALALLAEPTPAERAALGAIRYSLNRTVLHTDRTFLPRHPAAHAAWNYVADPDTARVAVTYSMTRLQGLPDRPYLVTLNPRREPRGILHEVEFAHPQFDRAAITAREHLERMAGTLGTYFAGAHFGFGFHEDGLRSGAGAAERLLADARSAA